MKKYNVRLYFHTSLEIEVMAPDRQTAIEYAREKSEDSAYDRLLLRDMQEDDSPDVYVWKDQLKDYQAV